MWPFELFWLLAKAHFICLATKSHNHKYQPQAAHPPSTKHHFFLVVRKEGEEIRQGWGGLLGSVMAVAWFTLKRSGKKMNFPCQ